MRKFFMAVAAVGLLAGSACGGGSNDDPKPSAPVGGPAAAVTIKGLGTTWDSDDVTIEAGEVVEWLVDGSIVHDLKGDDGVFHKASSKYVYTHKYSKPGTYSYQCTIHPGMTGTVTAN